MADSLARLRAPDPNARDRDTFVGSRVGPALERSPAPAPAAIDPSKPLLRALPGVNGLIPAPPTGASPATAAPRAAKAESAEWLYLSEPAAQALYKRMVPLATESRDPESSMAASLGVGMRRVPDQGRLEKLDRLYQMPPSFPSIEEAQRWRPEVQAASGEGMDLSFIARARTPFDDLAARPPEAQRLALADPRREYARSLGLLDGKMPPLPAPSPPDARPNAWMYATDPGQQALVRGSVPLVTEYDPDQSPGLLGRGGRQVGDERALDLIDKLYRLPTRFGSVEEARAYSPPPKRPRAGEAVDAALLIYNNTEAKQHPFEQIGLLPDAVQAKIIEDPRLTFAGLHGMVSGTMPEGYKPMESQPTPSGRYVSFERKMGGYHPKWAAEAKWVDGVGIAVPEAAVFVPHQSKKDLFGDVILPGVASIGAMAVLGAAGGPILGTLAQGLAGATMSDGNVFESVGLAFASSLAGLAKEPIGGTLGEALGSARAGSLAAGAIMGGAGALVTGGEAGIGALLGAAGALFGRSGEAEPADQQGAADRDLIATAGEPGARELRPLPSYVVPVPDAALHRDQLALAAGYLDEADQLSSQALAYDQAQRGIQGWHSENEAHTQRRGIDRAVALYEQAQRAYLKAAAAAGRAFDAAAGFAETSQANALFARADAGAAAVKAAARSVEASRPIEL